MIEKTKPQQCRRGRVAVFGLLLAGLGFAQEAQITGQVTDSSGAIIPDVKVTVTNTGTGIARQTTTNGLGYYSVPLLEEFPSLDRRRCWIPPKPAPDR